MLIDGPVETLTWTYFIKMLATNDIITDHAEKGGKSIIVITKILTKNRVLTI